MNNMQEKNEGKLNFYQIFFVDVCNSLNKKYNICIITQNGAVPKETAPLTLIFLYAADLTGFP